MVRGNAIFNVDRIFDMMDSQLFMDFLIPFFLIFAVVWASLSKIKIFEDRKVNTIIALMISLITVVPHLVNKYPSDKDPIDIIMGSIPQVAVVLLAIVMLLVLLGVFFKESTFEQSFIGGWVSIICIIVIVWIFGASAGWWRGWNSVENYIGIDAISLVVILIVFGIIINFITSDGKETTGDKFVDKVGKFFGEK